MQINVISLQYIVHTASNQNRRQGRPGNEAMYMLQTWVLFFKCKIAFEMHGCNTKLSLKLYIAICVHITEYANSTV